MSTPHAGPARPGSWLRPGSPAPAAAAPTAEGCDALAGLPDLPVAEHADLLAAEHDRLHRLLATIDQL